MKIIHEVIQYLYILNILPIALGSAIVYLKDDSDPI